PAVARLEQSAHRASVSGLFSHGSDDGSRSTRHLRKLDINIQKTRTQQRNLSPSRIPLRHQLTDLVQQLILTTLHVHQSSSSRYAVHSSSSDIGRHDDTRNPAMCSTPTHTTAAISGQKPNGITHLRRSQKDRETGPLIAQRVRSVIPLRRTNVGRRLTNNLRPLRPIATIQHRRSTLTLSNQHLERIPQLAHRKRFAHRTRLGSKKVHPI